MVDTSNQAKSIFLEAIEKLAPEQWPAFLDEICAEDPALRARVDRLLAAQAQLGSFHEAPSLGIVSTTSQPITERLGSVIGPYKLMEQIGEGGMGLVFVAEQYKPVRRKVALKLIKPGMDTRQVIARFEAERQALALMNHANIAKVFDGGETPSGRPYFVMELVRGVPITEYCDENRVAPRARLELFGQVCAAIQHAHQKGIIHRDIKPSNVMVVSHDGTPVVKVIDFGVSKAIGQQLTDKTVYTQFVQFIGTPLYMSPEQAGQSGLDIDTRTDIYALGVLLYELLTGTTPFDKERLASASHDEIRRVIREEEPPKPSKRISTMGQVGSTMSARRQSDSRQLSVLLRGELDWIVMKALEKDRNRRYESASALAADVQRYLRDEPVEACPPSRRYRFQKFARKHRKSLLTVGTLTACAILLVAVLVLFVSEKTNRLARVEQQSREALAGARTAIEAGDLLLAHRRIAEAQASLATDRELLLDLAADVDRTQQEIKDRQSDDVRLSQFVKLAGEAQDKMSFNSDLAGDRIAKEALRLYGVLDANDWFTRLDDSYLTPHQKLQVRETAYVTLVTLADWCLRWRGKLDFDRTRTERALEFLKRAEAFHEPTRAWYFVRSEYHRRYNDLAASLKYRNRFAVAKAETAWDYFLPGHTAGSQGDVQEAIRSYEAALNLQPNHYNSLFFLGKRLSSLNRYDAAIHLFRACEILRPNDVAPYADRLLCYVDSGRLDELEAQEFVLMRRHKESSSPESEIAFQRLGVLTEFYEKAGRINQRDRLSQEMIKLLRTAKVLDAVALANALANSGRILLSQGHYGKAESQLSECLAIREERSPESWLRFHVQSMLGEALFSQGKCEEAERHVREGYLGLKAQVLTIPAPYREVREREVEDRMPRLYDAWGKKVDADRWRASFANSFIRSWLILSEPLQYHQKEMPTIVDRVRIPDEEKLRPQAGDPIHIDDKDLFWKEHRNGNKFIDLVAVYPQTYVFRLTYMVCYIHAAADIDAVLGVANDDQAKLYLNGHERHRSQNWQNFRLDRVPVSLNKGSNTLVLKIINGEGPWGASVCIYRKDGLPPTEGLEFRLTR